ncbi:hypothetical protein WME79_30730 [Sorangium sp. So ce726]|uniref:hypothetical protein n=1 Tax=Sorangium sp. So ce726 TaxID=3133319 RepID=UPI003F601E0C
MSTPGFLRGASILAAAALGLAAGLPSAEAWGDDPAWVALKNEIERPHTRLASPALRALGGGALPYEAREAMAAVREAAVATLGGIGAELALWGVDPVARFDAALREMQPALSRSLLD